jgi:hypothetical protein
MKGIIYKIIGYGLTYYGEGVFDLEERKQSHVKWYNERNIKGCPSYCSSFEILKQGNDWDIILLEEDDYISYQELTYKCQYYKNISLYIKE